MKYTVLLFFVLFSETSFSQITDTLKKQPNMEPGVVTFITKVDIATATKDGIYLNGYVVNIDYARAKKLNGKRIKVSGKVTIVKGLNSQPKEFKKNGEEIMYQGRSEDTKHIERPKIKIIG
jgi:hypothetical protein